MPIYAFSILRLKNQLKMNVLANHYHFKTIIMEGNNYTKSNVIYIIFKMDSSIHNNWHQKKNRQIEVGVKPKSDPEAKET